MDSPAAHQGHENAPASVAAPAAGSPDDPHAYVEGFRVHPAGGFPVCSRCGYIRQASLHLCQFDACRLLTGRQRRYATGACRAAAYDQEHPRIAAPGVEPAGGPPIQTLIAALLADGRQRTAPEIAYEIRRDSATVARELRKMRAKQKQARLVAVVPGGGHERARWFMRAAA